MVNQHFNLALFCRHLRPTKADIVWLMLISMLFNAVVPLAANAMSYKQDPTGSDSANQILLCTSSGYRWVDLRDLTDTRVDSAHCLMCLSGDHDLDAVLDSDNVHDFNQSHQLQAITALADFPSTFSSPPRARAPPTIL
ncbi:MAG: hypothetical protein ACJAQ6_002461 [Arenicella sp.]|jgi:hypothetical protein